MYEKIERFLTTKNPILIEITHFNIHIFMVQKICTVCNKISKVKAYRDLAFRPRQMRLSRDVIYVRFTRHCSC